MFVQHKMLCGPAMSTTNEGVSLLSRHTWNLLAVSTSAAPGGAFPHIWRLTIYGSVVLYIGLILKMYLWESGNTGVCLILTLTARIILVSSNRLMPIT